MTEKKITINLFKANIFSLVLAAVIGIISIIIWLVFWGNAPAETSSFRVMIGSAVFCCAILLGIVIHELIHGLTWALFAEKGWKSISFGIIWKMLTPYCHCNQPLSLKTYIIGCLMPLIVLGIVPWVIGLCFGIKIVIVWGVVFIACAAGDILVAWKLRHESSSATILDHPTEAGCIVYYPD